MACYTAFLMDGITCQPPPASTPDGTCETILCKTTTTAGQNQNLFVWTDAQNMVIDVPTGNVYGQVTYLQMGSQPTCADVAAQINSPNWKLATVNGPSNGKITVSAPAIGSQPRVYWFTIL